MNSRVIWIKKKYSKNNLEMSTERCLKMNTLIVSVGRSVTEDMTET